MNSLLLSYTKTWKYVFSLNLRNPGMPECQQGSRMPGTWNPWNESGIPGDSGRFRSHLAPEDALRVREFIGFGEMRRGIPPAELRPYIILIRGFQQRAPSLPEASDQPQGGPRGSSRILPQTVLVRLLEFYHRWGL